MQTSQLTGLLCKLIGNCDQTEDWSRTPKGKYSKDGCAPVGSTRPSYLALGEAHIRSVLKRRFQTCRRLVMDMGFVMGLLESLPILFVST